MPKSSFSFPTSQTPNSSFPASHHTRSFLYKNPLFPNLPSRSVPSQSLLLQFGSMKGISKSPLRRNDGFHRYLKPGALAQIRNSRINARSNSPLTPSLPHRVDPESPVAEAPLPQTLTVEQMPHLLSKVYGPYRIGRKKLGPARAVLRTMMNLNPSPNSLLESTSGNSNVLNSNDVLVAH